MKEKGASFPGVGGCWLKDEVPEWRLIKHGAGSPGFLDCVPNDVKNEGQEKDAQVKQEGGGRNRKRGIADDTPVIRPWCVSEESAPWPSPTSRAHAQETLANLGLCPTDLLTQPRKLTQRKVNAILEKGVGTSNRTIPYSGKQKCKKQTSVNTWTLLYVTFVCVCCRVQQIQWEPPNGN